MCYRKYRGDGEMRGMYWYYCEKCDIWIRSKVIPTNFRCPKCNRRIPAYNVYKECNSCGEPVNWENKSCPSSNHIIIPTQYFTEGKVIIQD